MVLFVWFDELILDKSFPSCKNWYPAVILKAESEKEAWEKLYKFSPIEWAKYQYNKPIMQLPGMKEIETQHKKGNLETRQKPKQFEDYITWNANY